ncbi:MAG: tetratricopeptide repeat protein [Pseudomonadota bacterium]
MSEPVVPTVPPAQPEMGALPEIDFDGEVDALLAALSVADESSWQPLQQKIMALWARSESAAMTFLLSRATRAMEAGEHEDALEFLDDLVRLAPDFAEAWNRRATVHFMMENYGPSVADIQRTLALEPRHFGALAGLGIILDRLDQDAQALQVFRRALEIHPHLQGAKEAVERLSPEVDGREL